MMSAVPDPCMVEYEPSVIYVPKKMRVLSSRELNELCRKGKSSMIQCPGVLT